MRLPYRIAPARSRKYLDWIRSLDCAACGISQRRQSGLTEAAHTGRRGLSQIASDYSAIPLCAHCHRTGPDSYHAGVRRFSQVHGLDVEVLVARLNAMYVTETGLSLFEALDAGYRRSYRHIIETDREGFEVAIGTILRQAA